jgi:streptogramin lyase
LLDGKITTFSGDGAAEHDGDGGLAAQASLHGARAVEVGSNGHIYIVEREGNSVRAIDPNTGLICTIAGKGSLGYGGDGGPPSKATFRGPKEIAATPEGDLFIVDTENHAIRKIDGAAETITTIAGTGERGHEGAGGPASRMKLDRPHGVAVAPDGAVWIVDTGNHRLVRVGPK